MGGRKGYCVSILFHFNAKRVESLPLLQKLRKRTTRKRLPKRVFRCGIFLKSISVSVIVSLFVRLVLFMFFTLLLMSSFDNYILVHLGEKTVYYGFMEDILPVGHFRWNVLFQTNLSTSRIYKIYIQ